MRQVSARFVVAVALFCAVALAQHASNRLAPQPWSISTPDDIEITLAVEAKLPYNPILGGPAGIQGFRDFMGYDDDDIAEIKEEAKAWFKKRFGLDFYGVPHDPVTDIAVIRGGSVAWIPISYNGSGNYRVQCSNTARLTTSRNNRPAVRLSEYILSFTGDVNLTGTYGANYPNPIAPGVAPAFKDGGVAYGVYLIQDGGFRHMIKMKSYVPSVRWSFEPLISGFIERFLLQSNAFGDGWGTLDIFYPVPDDGVDHDNNSSTPNVFPWHVRNQWNFKGDMKESDLAYPALFKWDQ